MIYLVAISLCLVFASVIVFMGEAYPRSRGHRRGYPRRYTRPARAGMDRPRRIRSIILIALAIGAGAWQEVRNGHITDGWVTLGLVAVVIFGILVWASEAEAPARRRGR